MRQIALFAVCCFADFDGFGNFFHGVPDGVLRCRGALQVQERHDFTGGAPPLRINARFDTERIDDAQQYPAAGYRLSAQHILSDGLLGCQMKGLYPPDFFGQNHQVIFGDTWQ